MDQVEMLIHAYTVHITVKKFGVSNIVLRNEYLFSRLCIKYFKNALKLIKSDSKDSKEKSESNKSRFKFSINQKFMKKKTVYKY